MGNDNRAELVLDGDISPLRQKLREAAADLKKLGTDGSAAIGSMTSPLGALQAKFLAIAGLLAGGAVFQKMISGSLELTAEAVKLSKVFGMSTKDASELNVALKLTGQTAEDFSGMAFKLLKHVEGNAAGMEQLGLKTKDAHGHLLPMMDLMKNASKLLLDYKEGTDRDAAALYLFGKGAQEALAILKLNEQVMSRAKQMAHDYGLVIGDENAEAAKKFKQEQAAVGIVMEAMREKIAGAVMPVFMSLAAYFTDVGPTAIKVFVWGLKHLIQFVEETILLVRMAGSHFEEYGKKVGTRAGMIWDALKAATTRGGETVKEALARADEELKAIEKASAADRVKINEEAAARVAKMWGEPHETGGTSADKTGKGTKRWRPPVEKKAAAESPGHMATYEAVLAERKNLYEQENILRQFSKQQELAYWRELQATYEINSKDQLAIAKRTATLELEIRREMTRQGIALTGIEIEGQRAAALEKIDALKREAEFAQAQNQITKDQLLAQQQQFLAQRYEIELQAALQLQELASINGDDPVEMAKLRQQQLEIERNYERELGDIQGQRILESTKNYRDMYASIETGFASVLKNFLTGSQTIGQTITGLFRAVGDAVAGMLANLAARWLLQQLLQLVGIKTTAVGTIQAKAAEAGAGGVASMAAAPFPINMTAPAFGAMMAGIAASYAGVVASAARGYDIPKGLNPMTQLHEEEMVLPQKYANVIRGIAGGEAAGAASGDTYINNINAMDMKSFKRFVIDNYAALGPATRRMARNGTPVRGRTDS